MVVSQTEGSAAPVDVAGFIDQQPVGGFQIRLLLTCATVLLLDGFDTTAIGFVAPSLAKEWGLSKGALGPVFSAGLFGLMIGASSGATSASDTQMKFGVGAGLGYQWKEWSARVNVHTHDVGNFGDAVMLTGGVGYQFAGF